MNERTTQHRTTPTTIASRAQSSLVEHLRTFKLATWLGWQIESNWAEPIMFFVLAILRPLAAALILLLMYEVISGGGKDAYFDYIYVSNALFVIVTQVLVGMSWTIFEDRENYKMLKYIFTSPARTFAFISGRAVAKILIGLFTSFLLLLVGVLFMDLHLRLDTIDWGWLILYSITGLTILLAMGLALAGFALVLARNGEFMGEISAAAVLLISGVYFPPDILPLFLRKLSLVMPLTYWLEGMRRALFGGILQVASADGLRPLSPSLAQYSNLTLFLILLGCAIASAVAAWKFYQWVELEAKERGMIDRVTGY
jgi:ABC-2 type transport system permease protein